MSHYSMRWARSNSDCDDVAAALPTICRPLSMGQSRVDLTSGGHLWPPMGHLANVYHMPTSDERSETAATPSEGSLSASKEPYSASMQRIRQLEKRLRQLEQGGRRHHRGWTQGRVAAVLRAAASSGAASVIFGPQAGHMPDELSRTARRRSSSTLEDAVEVVGQEMHRAMLAEATSSISQDRR